MPLDENFSSLTQEIIGAAIEVSNTLGTGFLEKVYERALLVELRRRNIKAAAQVPITVTYKEETVGDYTPDLLVEDTIIVELKCVEDIRPEHLAQCINYLRATNKSLCLLFNFQKPKLQWRRLIR